MLDKLSLRLKSWSRSRYILRARYAMGIIGLKYVKMQVYERPLNTEIPAIKAKVPVEVRLVSVEDVNNGHYRGVRLATGDDPLQHTEMLRRISNEDVCFAAIAGHKVAGFAWLHTRERKYEPSIETEIKLVRGESLVYDAVVFPEFRKKGIQKRLLEERVRFLKSNAFEKVYVYVDTDNIPSIKAIEATGFYPVKTITCLRVFWFKRIREHAIIRRSALRNEWINSEKIKC